MSEGKVLTSAVLKSCAPDLITNIAATIVNFDTVLTPGQYRATQEYTANFPEGAYKYGTLLVFGATPVIQMYFPHYGGKMYTRAIWNDVGPWYCFNSTVLT